MNAWDLHVKQVSEGAKPYSAILAGWTLFCSIPSLSLTGSILVILIMCWRRRGLSLDEQLSVVLMTFDFFSSFSMLLIGVFNLIPYKMIINDEQRCKFFTLFFIFCFHNSIYSICFISIERYRKIKSNRYLSYTKFYILMALVFGSHLALDILGFWFGAFKIQNSGCYCLPDPTNSFSKVIIGDIFIKGTLTLGITTFCYISICYLKCQASIVTVDAYEFSKVSVKQLVMDSPTNRKVVYRAIIIVGFYILSYFLMVVNAVSELITEESRVREMDFFSYILMSMNPIINTAILLNLNTKLNDLFWNTFNFGKKPRCEPYC